MSVLEYDDDVALRAYLWHHCSEYLTPLERRVAGRKIPMISIVPNDLVGASREKYLLVYKAIEKRDGHVEDSEIVNAHKIPQEIRKRKALDRLIREQYDELPLNRCPKCIRLVRTPVAKQCVWCKHDWH